MKKPNSFYNLETLGGILLFISAVVAIIVANSPLQDAYEHLLQVQGQITLGSLDINKPLLLWINDGLMAIYFLLIGLEIKREIKRGVLSDKKDLKVPVITALSGLLVPALIFTWFNIHNPIYIQGWAIPTATDIAFSLGIISLLGSRVPLSLKILLTAIAIFDDIAAIAIIAVYYTQKLSLASMLLALLLTVILIGLNYFNCRRVSIFMVVGVLLWIAVLESGVHATLAGIILAMTIPDSKKNSLLNKIEEGLHPWIVFLVLPIFAFANAGVSFKGFNFSYLLHPIVLGIALGLFLGKQIGIFLSLSYFVKFKGLFKGGNITFRQLYGLALICGVGFTMSLFIGSLAYQDNNLTLLPLVKIGVLLGSMISGITGFGILKYIKG